MTYSNLITDTILSPNCYKTRNDCKIERLTIHCFVGQVTAKRGGEVFQSPTKKASCNYVVGKDGDICLVVPEEYTSWCSSNRHNDERSITFECASNNVEPYDITNDCYNSLLNLIVDIMKRYNKNTLVFFNNKKEAENYKVKDNELLLTVHRFYANKSCPGTYLWNKHLNGTLISDILERLNNVSRETLYCVQFGAFKNKQNAINLCNELKSKGYDCIIKEIQK